MLLLKKDRDKKIQLIDMVRAFAILVVMASHLGYRCLVPKNQLLKDIWVGISTKGMFGVSLFFVVSGFLITRLIDKNLGGLEYPDPRSFYTRRVARIVPLLLLVVLVGIVLLRTFPEGSSRFDYYFHDPNARFDWMFWLSIPTFFLNWVIVFSKTIGHRFGSHWDVLWSLSIEEQFYLFYPLVLRAKGLKPLLPVFLGLFLVLGVPSRWIAYSCDPTNTNAGFMNSFSGFEEIALGILLYLLCRKKGGFFEKNQWLSIFLCSAGFFVILKIFTIRFELVDFIWAPLGFGLGLFLFLLGGLHLRLFNSLLFMPWALVGQVSFGMYLWHIDFLYMLSPWLEGHDTWFAFGAFFLATYLFALASYYFFEKPANRAVRGALAPQSL